MRPPEFHLGGNKGGIVAFDFEFQFAFFEFENVFSHGGVALQDGPSRAAQAMNLSANRFLSRFIIPVFTQNNRLVPIT